MKLEIFFTNLSKQCEVVNVTSVKFIEKDNGETMVLDGYMNTVFELEGNSVFSFDCNRCVKEYEVKNPAFAFIKNNEMKIFLD